MKIYKSLLAPISLFLLATLPSIVIITRVGIGIENIEDIVISLSISWLPFGALVALVLFFVQKIGISRLKRSISYGIFGFTVAFAYHLVIHQMTSAAMGPYPGYLQESALVSLIFALPIALIATINKTSTRHIILVPVVAVLITAHFLWPW